MDDSFFVAYSRMDDTATAWLDKALKAADPEKMGRLKTAEFTTQLAKIYTELDYIHPFSDGNSRTLRSFTKQLAKSAGYELDWKRFDSSDAGRDLLYIARDLKRQRPGAAQRPERKHHAPHLAQRGQATRQSGFARPVARCCTA